MNGAVTTQPDEQVVHRFPKTRTEEVRASLSTYKGMRIADVRVYFFDVHDEPHPTKKGLAIRAEDLPLLREAVDALIRAEALRAAA